MASSATSSRPLVDREATVPFYLKLFYSLDDFHPLTDFPTPTPGSDEPLPELPPYLQIYTWQSCTLRELATLLSSTLRDMFPDPIVSTRLSFRLIYPDVRNARLIPDVPGRYLSKDMGNVFITAEVDDAKMEDDEQGGKQDGDGASGTNGDATKEQHPTKSPQQKKNTSVIVEGDDADRMLQDFRFVIGDYVDCAIQPPLEDGSVAPPPAPAPRNPPPQSMAGSSIGGNMRAFDRPESPGPGMGRGGYGYGYGRRGSRESIGIPPGEWRRGDRPPDHESPWTRGGRRGRF